MAANPELAKLPPLDELRKVRREVLKAINRNRAEESLPPIDLDIYANEAASQYAEFCANNNLAGNNDEMMNIVKSKGLPGQYQALTGYRYLEEEEMENAERMLTKLFLDAHGLTFEQNETRLEIMKKENTHAGLGFAIKENLLMVAELYSIKPLRIESIKATEDARGIEVIGKMDNDQFGPYACSVINKLEPTKPLCMVGPDKMSYDQKTFQFMIFIDKPELLYANPPFIIEIYLRTKPLNIPYMKPFTEDLSKSLGFLQLAYKTPMELYPDPRILMEDTEDRAKEEQEELEKRKREEEEKEIKIAEREARKKIWEQRVDQIKEMAKNRDDDLGTPMASIENSLGASISRSQISATPSEDAREQKSSLERSASKSSIKSAEKGKEEEVKEVKEEEKKIETLEGQIELEKEKRIMDMQEKDLRGKLETTIKMTREDLMNKKKENTDLQHQVALLLQKREQTASAGDVAMNELKYLNALINVTQVRMEMKKAQEHYNKMTQDLQEQLVFHQRRCAEMRQSFKEFKRAVAEGAEYNRSGKQISKKEIDKWESEEEKKDEELQQMRFTYISKKRVLKKKEKEVKEKDKLAENLHIIDFEQLKIENQTLNEKIEERNESIQALNTKIRKAVIQHTHMREKLYQLKIEYEKYEKEKNELKDKADAADKSKTVQKNELAKKEKYLKIKKKKAGFLGAKKGKMQMATKWEKIGAPKIEVQDVKFDDEFKKNLAEIKQLKEVEIPKWEKRRKEIEAVIKKAKFAKERKAEGL